MRSYDNLKRRQFSFSPQIIININNTYTIILLIKEYETTHQKIALEISPRKSFDAFGSPRQHKGASIQGAVIGRSRVINYAAGGATDALRCLRS